MHPEKPTPANEHSHAPYRNLFAPSQSGNRPVVSLTHPPAANNIPATPAAIAASETPHYSAADYPGHFIQELTRSIVNARQDNSDGALFILSVNNLAMIMNAFGHDGAEKVVTQLIELLQGLCGKDNKVDRLNRDQIGIILHACNKEEMAIFARKFHSAIQDYGSTSLVGALHVTCSVGSVNFPSSAESASDALDKAYIALHSTYGISYRSYDETRDEGVLCRQQMGLANYLRRSIQENRLRLAFQPIVDASTGKVGHYEALLRLIAEDGKISSAGALIPVAERMGLIDTIDHLVFDMVVEELRASPNIVLAFNVSNITTDNPVWLEHATSTLKDNPGIASRMIVEITETAAQRDLRRTAYFVASLQAQGCQVALDDFGSGYTSFRQLKALSVDIVKIDGAFIKDLVDNADNRFFVKTLLDFAKGFGLTTVAEYVERGETAKMLMELGVDFMQGYYFGKPENFRSWRDSGEYNRS